MPAIGYSFTSRLIPVLAALLVVATAGCGEDPQSPTDPPEPTMAVVPAAGALSWVQVSPGPGHTCGVTTTDQLYCWGYNYFGQLGDGTTSNRLTPVRVQAGGLRFRRTAPTAGASTSGGGSATGRPPGA